jgi:hypothetical protein
MPTPGERLRRLLSRRLIGEAAQYVALLLVLGVTDTIRYASCDPTRSARRSFSLAYGLL